MNVLAKQNVCRLPKIVQCSRSCGQLILFYLRDHLTIYNNKIQGEKKRRKYCITEVGNRGESIVQKYKDFDFLLTRYELCACQPICSTNSYNFSSRYVRLIDHGFKMHFEKIIIIVIRLAFNVPRISNSVKCRHKSLMGTVQSRKTAFDTRCVLA